MNSTPHNPAAAGPGPDARFEAALRQGRFEIQKCADCGGHVFYPRYLCPHCGSVRLVAERASGKGVVYSTSVVRRRPDRGGDFNVCLVDLAEGPRMMSRVVGMPPDKVAIGMAVRAKVSEIDGVPAVVFEQG
ncbi:MAG: DNA-binding protein [Candidimonas sp.]|nr:MAG: DNA-binding protein [Candidimonas sp.]